MIKTILKEFQPWFWLYRETLLGVLVGSVLGTTGRSLDLYLAADVDGDPDDHGGYGDTSDESDAHRCPDESTQLPEDLLLSAPRFLPPERAARWTERERERTTDFTYSSSSFNISQHKNQGRRQEVPQAAFTHLL